MKITLLTGRTYDIAEELGFPIKVVKSAVAKRLTLRIDEKNRLPVLTVPKYCSARKAVAFVEDHRDWIANTLARIPQSREFAPGEMLSIMGRMFRLVHCPNTRCGAGFEKDTLVICGGREFFHRRTTDFLKQLAQRELLSLSQAKASLINCRIHRLCIKDTKSRWGSCSNKANINYNWRIIFAPDYVINYLVCHEVAHLAHQDHSAEFWQCVEQLCPDYREGRAWLKVKGKTLYQYV